MEHMGKLLSVQTKPEIPASADTGTDTDAALTATYRYRIFSQNAFPLSRASWKGLGSDWEGLRATGEAYWEALEERGGHPAVVFDQDDMP